LLKKIFKKKFIFLLMLNWTENAKENFFNLLKPSMYANDLINCEKVIVKKSKIIKSELGVFSKVKIKKGEIIEWGIATIIPDIDVRDNDKFYTWDGENRSKAATVSGCGLFYNTLGDKSNARCVPYHSENRFEIYALKNIDKDEEITFRYDSMNYRKGMKHLIPIVGKLKNGIE